MKRRSIVSELFEVRAAALALYQNRGVVTNKEDAKRWEALRQALRVPPEEKQAQREPAS